MADDDKPLSTLVAQGWEILHYTSGMEMNEGHVDCFLLRRQKAHKVLKVRRKMIGKGYVVKEMDV